VRLVQLVSLGEQHRALDGVAQLAHVPGPGVALERRQRVPGDALDLLAELLIEQLDVVGDQQANVVAPLSQRRQRHRHHVEAVEQVLAELALLHFLLQGSVRGGNDAHVDLNIRGAADALERLLFEEAQELGLEQGHHLADFVEEYRAAVGRFQQAALLPVGAGERAALVAEQLALEQRLGQRRARDVHERLRRSITAVVNDLRCQVLAGAALAGE
jgi:hypothetical protein